MNKTALLISAAAVAFAAPALAADKETYKSETKVEQDSKGNYEASSSTKQTNAAGTTTSAEKKVEVDVDSDGETETKVKTTEVTDPKGLMNKSKTVTIDTETANADGTVDSSHKVKVNGKTVEQESTKH